MDMTLDLDTAIAAPKAIEPYLLTLSGRKFHFLNPRSEDICINDIAHQTAMKCRFGGAVTHFYSVAQHSVLVSRALEQRGANWATRMAGLLHDANEAYLPDLQRPIKDCIADTWATLEEPAETAIYHHFLYPEVLADVDWTEVKRADNFLLVLEARALLNDSSWSYEPHWKVDPDATIRDVDPNFVPMLPLHASKFFLKEFSKIFNADDFPKAMTQNRRADRAA